MDQGLKLLLYPVSDIARAKRLYRKPVGTEPYVDQPYHVGFRVGDLEIGLDPQGHKKGMKGSVGYWQHHRPDPVTMMCQRRNGFAENEDYT